MVFLSCISEELETLHALPGFVNAYCIQLMNDLIQMINRNSTYFTISLFTCFPNVKRCCSVLSCECIYIEFLLKELTSRDRLLGLDTSSL